MLKPETPSNEEERVSTLQNLGVLDTPSDERFDRLTRLARRIFNVPIALVSLVDSDRQWFKSCFGLDASETSREISFCGHAILGDEIFLIPDALEDPRFADNPLVTEPPNIRFYAGCPLSSVEGYKLGTLCIIDRKPRNFSDDDLNALRDLASMAERELQAYELAISDELTHLTNRRGFISLAEKALMICQRKQEPACLLFFDLNKFKYINDNFGHAQGDRVLQLFARCMRETYRDSDVYARIGGDEFVVLETNTTYQDAKDSVVRLRDAVELVNTNQLTEYKISFSVGVLFIDDLSNSIESLLEKTDHLMYQDKNK